MYLHRYKIGRLIESQEMCSNLYEKLKVSRSDYSIVLVLTTKPKAH